MALGVPIGVAAMHNWCVANGISVALNQDTQRTAKDLLDELSVIGNSAPVYIGDTLFFIPYDEVSTVGNGAIYVAPTAGGPIKTLTDQDFAIDDGGQPMAPLQFTRKRRTDCDNVVAIEFVDRSIDYAQNVVTDCDQKAVALYGPRKGGTLDAASLGIGTPSGSKLLKSLSNKTAAQKIASILVKRSAAGVPAFTFTLKAEYCWVTAMDLFEIEDPRLLGSTIPVRITSVKETNKRTYQCEADQYIYGLNHPTLKDTTQATGTLVSTGYDPGFVNPPVIFQPTCAMSKNTAQVWFVVSGADPNFGGSFPCVSIDGGVSYTAPGEMGFCPAGTTGYLTLDFPTLSPEQDPDTTDDLAVDLTECNGVLTSQSQSVADASLDMCYVAGSDFGITVQNGGVNVAMLGSIQNAGTDVTGQVIEIDDEGVPVVLAEGDFEAVCPTVVTKTAAHKYSMGTYIRRAVKDSTYADHGIGSRFAALDTSVFVVDLESYWVGRTLLFKFPAVNKAGGQMNNLPDCAVYAFIPQSSLCL